MFSFAAVRNVGALILVLMTISVVSYGQQRDFGQRSGGSQRGRSILDDSSKLVYGPKTTLQFTELGFMNNKYDTISVDTSLYELEKFAFIDQLQQTYQDLGNIGTAMNPLFFEAPQVSGLRSGYHAYDPLVKTPEKMRYYDTKSPFINLHVVLGGHGRSMIDVLYTQNINPNWNIGFEINRLNIDKQLGAQQTEGDRNLESTQMNLFTQYQHPEKPYKLLAYINQFNHNVVEVGGIYFTDSSSNAEIFQYRDATILLRDATAKEKRRDIHLIHSYDLFKQFQLYHRFDFNSQKLTYTDFTDGSSGVFDTYLDFYPDFFIDEDSTYQHSNFNILKNEIGLKGNIESVYYRLYTRQRRVNHRWLYLDDADADNEVYLGGLSRFTWRDIFSVEAMAEIMQTGDYLIEGKLSSDLINASYRSQLYQPSSLQNRYFGNHYEWSNSFNSTFVNELDGSLTVDWKGFKLSPNARFTTLSNYVYYDTLSQPSQISDPLLISRLGVDIALNVPTDRTKGYGFRFETTGYFTEVTGNNKEAYPVPRWFANSRWYWRGNWFQDDIPVQLGFNIHARSSYFGRGYSPSIQQYHVQDDQELDGYFTIDPFISMKVNRVMVFFKITHANMLLENGYFITPNYLGQERVFDFGVRWLFFD
jgi:hypothetical protein